MIKIEKKNFPVEILLHFSSLSFLSSPPMCVCVRLCPSATSRSRRKNAFANSAELQCTKITMRNAAGRRANRQKRLKVVKRNGNGKTNETKKNIEFVRAAAPVPLTLLCLAVTPSKHGVPASRCRRAQSDRCAASADG